MKALLTTLAGCLALAGTPLAAATDQAPKDGERQICKREKKVNSRFATQVCRTKAEWDAIAEANRRAYGEQRDQPQFNPPGD